MAHEWPSRSQWRHFLKILTNKEKALFFTFSFLAIYCAITLATIFYYKNTTALPAFGGSYTEGMLGSPRYINPVYSIVSDVDRDLTELIYSGLMKYDKEQNIVYDLAKEYQTQEDGRIYEFYLKENLFWSDGKPLTAEDVAFTIKTIQNPSFKSPLRANWLGVKADVISELGIRFELKSSSSVFLENCTLKIMPKHIWQDISFQNFSLSPYNLKPIGSGPYQMDKIDQNQENKIESLKLVPNPKYSGKTPNIPELNFIFFDSEEDLIKASEKKKIDGFSLGSLVSGKEIENKSLIEHRMSLPRYFAVFFNLKSKILSEEKIRIALNNGTNKEEIAKSLSLSNDKIVESPILPDIYGFEKPSITYGYNQDLANQLLDEAGFLRKDGGNREKFVKRTPAFQFKTVLKVGSSGTEVKELQKCLSTPPAGGPDYFLESEINGYFGEKTKAAVIKFQEKYRADILDPENFSSGTGEVKPRTQDKLNQLCSAPAEETIPFSLVLATANQKTLIDVANNLKKQWAALGLNIEVKTYDISSLEEEVIKPRNYDLLLFGEILGAIPDPYPFWHSSQVKDPGFNLTGYENKECDKLLEEARQTLDENKRKEDLEKFQNILLEEAPSIFLYNPDYIYFVSKKIQGIDNKVIADPSKRFNNVEDWYIKTKRAW